MGCNVTLYGSRKLDIGLELLLSCSYSELSIRFSRFLRWSNSIKCLTFPLTRFLSPARKIHQLVTQLSLAINTSKVIRTSLLAVLSTLRIAHAQDLHLLSPRNPFYGGFALPGDASSSAVNGCPSGLLTCSNTVYTFCCPNYTFCGPYQPGAYCCPTADDCGSVLNAASTCADPAWTLYEDAFIWCCKNETVGLALGDGECQPKALTYSTGEYAKTVRLLYLISSAFTCR